MPDLSEVSGDFWSGLCIGLIIALILGFIFIRLTDYWVKWGKRNRPLDTWPDSVQSSTTPVKIVRSSCCAGISFVLILLLVISSFILLISNGESILQTLRFLFPE